LGKIKNDYKNKNKNKITHANNIIEICYMENIPTIQTIIPKI